MERGGDQRGSGLGPWRHAGHALVVGAQLGERLAQGDALLDALGQRRDDQAVELRRDDGRGHHVGARDPREDDLAARARWRRRSASSGGPPDRADHPGRRRWPAGRVGPAGARPCGTHRTRPSTASVVADSWWASVVTDAPPGPGRPFVAGIAIRASDGPATVNNVSASSVASRAWTRPSTARGEHGLAQLARRRRRPDRAGPTPPPSGAPAGPARPSPRAPPQRATEGRGSRCAATAGRRSPPVAPLAAPRRPAAPRPGRHCRRRHAPPAGRGPPAAPRRTPAAAGPRGVTSIGPQGAAERRVRPGRGCRSRGP